MLNLTKKDLQKEFDSINRELDAVQQEIDDNHITNYGHKLYIKSYELIGAMKILQKLINKI
jgi:hypothetical protein